MEAASILQKLPAEIFHGPAPEIKQKYRDLVKVWHPDHCKMPEARKVFDHIRKSYDYVTKGAAKSLDLHTDGRTVRFSYLSEHRMSDIKVLVGATTINYLLTNEMRTWGRETLKRPWEFKDPKQKAEMIRFLPAPHRLTDATEGLLVTYHRPHGDVLLADLLAYHERSHTPLPPLAVMWIVSGLLNIACYMQIAGVTHCAFREEFVVVNLDLHETRLEGPPLFAAPMGRRPKYALAETLRDWPALGTKEYVIKNSRVDLTLIRSLTMRLLGHRTVRTLREDDNIPQGLRDWVTSPPPIDAIDDYVAWEDLRGKRAFHIYGLSARDVYVSLL